MLAAVSVFGAFDPRVVPPYLSLLGACLCPSGSWGVGVQQSLYPAFAVGSSSSVSRGTRPVRSSGSVRGVRWSSWLSPLPAAWFRFVEFSRFPVVLGWSFRYLPCGPYSRPLFGPLAVPPYLASCPVGIASPRL